ncbi:MAG: RdgB/HAM1 family non-canonical purine NTP pyrophosphatase [Epsilonproteobacteria bacterium]|nr:RdgB/HAM1 family non-canonical purine NTP pyrophosphatase [Campylobacterota bacterium]
MKIILASSNKGKIKEFKRFLNYEIIPYKEIVGDIEIEENGSTFAQNALIKAKTIFDLVDKDRYIVISDDSGISVEALNYRPGIFSARFAGNGATDKENLDKLINELKKRQLSSSKAFYTAAIAIASKWQDYIVHGWMYGEVIAQKRGENGFGYDPCFIPEGFDKTLGELEDDIKVQISHRSKALNLAKPILNMLLKD